MRRKTMILGVVTLMAYVMSGPIIRLFDDFVVWLNQQDDDDSDLYAVASGWTWKKTPR